MDDFFDLLSELLSSVELQEEDPRLVISVVRGDRIAVSMNSRYVLTAYPEESALGFIIRRGSKHTDELLEAADETYEFNALQGENADETPYWVKFVANDSPATILGEAISDHWIRASEIEFNRWSASPHKRFHEPLAQQAVADKEYRTQVLEDAFR
jgi:hypothetical protein